MPLSDCDKTASIPVRPIPGNLPATPKWVESRFTQHHSGVLLHHWNNGGGMVLSNYVSSIHVLLSILYTL